MDFVAEFKKYNTGEYKLNGHIVGDTSSDIILEPYVIGTNGNHPSVAFDNTDKTDEHGETSFGYYDPNGDLATDVCIVANGAAEPGDLETCSATVNIAGVGDFDFTTCDANGKCTIRFTPVGGYDHAANEEVKEHKIDYWVKTTNLSQTGLWQTGGRSTLTLKTYDIDEWKANNPIT